MIIRVLIAIVAHAPSVEQFIRVAAFPRLFVVTFAVVAVATHSLGVMPQLRVGHLVTDLMHLMRLPRNFGCSGEFCIPLSEALFLMVEVSSLFLSRMSEKLKKILASLIISKCESSSANLKEFQLYRTPVLILCYRIHLVHIFNIKQIFCDIILSTGFFCAHQY